MVIAPIKICENIIDRIAGLETKLCITKYIPNDTNDPNNIDFVKFNSKSSALENIIFIRDQTITGSAKRIQEVYVETSLKSEPNNEINSSDANPLKKKNEIGIANDNINTLRNLVLISETSCLFFALLNSGNNISKLAATNWNTISKIRLDQARTPNTEPE